MADRGRADPERLRDLLGAARGRRQRAAMGRMVRQVGDIAAARCDRFAIHADDPAAAEAERWLGTTVPPFGPYRDEEPLDGDGGPEAAMARLVARNGLTGWCLIVAGAACPDAPPAVATDAAALAALVADLRRALPCEYADSWIACREGGWSIKLFHEGWVQLWREG